MLALDSPLSTLDWLMIVTIDGPAGAGKSSAARGLAHRLGYRFLDTGAMYRAVTLAAREREIDVADADQMSELAREIRVELADDRVLLNGRDVTQSIRRFDITTSIHHAADNPAVRAQLVLWQRAAAQGADVVTEGRDQGTIVFPYAECKIFLTADEQERAQRRHRDLLARGENIPFDEVLTHQRLRDQRDVTRPVGALIKAKDAIEVSTDGLTADEVIARLEEIVRSKQ
jgi:CMP/dCMP kinase